MKLRRGVVCCAVMVMGFLYPTMGFCFHPPDDFGGPEAGETAPNFRLETLDGKTVELSQFKGKKPVVIEFGSYTCPVFRNQHRSMERLYQKYGDEAEFLLVYTVEAHPKNDPSPYSGREWTTDENRREGILVRQPTRQSERVKLAKRARSDLNIQPLIALDDMENSTWNKYGKAPNAAYLVGTDGRIKLRQGWFDADRFEKALKGELR